jgi:hypothetical protein
MNQFHSSNREENTKTRIETQYFNLISFLFLLMFIFYGMKNGIARGFKITVFIWCLTVCTTPISSASVLLSFPIKIFTTIPMFITKSITSVLSLGILAYFYHYNYNLICKIPLGRAFVKIIKSKLYALFLVSIIASVITSYMLDNFVDHFILSNTKMLDKDKLGEMLLLFLIFVFLNLIYFNILIKHKIFEFGHKYYVL